LSLLLLPPMPLLLPLLLLPPLLLLLLLLLLLPPLLLLLLQPASVDPWQDNLLCCRQPLQRNTDALPFPDWLDLDTGAAAAASAAAAAAAAAGDQMPQEAVLHEPQSNLQAIQLPKP
jgi:hypothetical protein